MSDSSNTSSNFSCPEYIESKHEISLDDTNVSDTSATNCLSIDYPNALSMSNKDSRYWEKRRKNNAAAKRSRERRRLHDLAMERQIQDLKQCNYMLQKQLADIQAQLKLDRMHYLNNDSIVNQKHTSNSFFKCDVQNIPQFRCDSENISLINSPETPSIISPTITISNTPNSASILPPSCSNFPTPKPLDLTIRNHHFKTSMINYTNDETDSNDNKANINYHTTNSNGVYSQCRNQNSHQLLRSKSKPEHDQRYLDRRRRNNEAVRKCRQNKKARLLNLQRMHEENQTTHNDFYSNNNQVNIDYNNNNKNNIISQSNSSLTINNQLEIPKLDKMTNEKSVCFQTVLTNENCNNNNNNFNNINNNNNNNNGCIRKSLPIKWKNKLIEANKLMQ